MTHGDLVPGNVLVADGRLAGGKAWAFAQAMGLVWYYVTTNPTMSFTGRRTLDRLLQEGSRLRSKAI